MFVFFLSIPCFLCAFNLHGERTPAVTARAASVAKFTLWNMIGHPLVRWPLLAVDVRNAVSEK